MTTGTCTSRTLVIVFACFWAWTSAVPAEIRSSHYVTTKRVFSTSSWQKDFAFFREFLGVVDPSGTSGPCLKRDLGWSLPVNFGIHFPQSWATSSNVPGGKDNEYWDSVRVKHTRTSLRYSAFHDFATGFFVPDLGPHVARLRNQSSPFLWRGTTDSEGQRLFSVILATPGSGQVFEIVAPACSECVRANASAAFPPAFGVDECAHSHKLQRPVAYYLEAWKRASAQFAALENGLPAPMLTQVRVALDDIEEAKTFVRQFFGEETVRDTAAAAAAAAADGPSGDGTDAGDSALRGCSIDRWTTGVAPFDGAHPHPPPGSAAPPPPPLPRVFPNYTLDYVFVHNPAAHDAATWGRYQAWANAMHAAWVGSGWGFDRVLDYHVKIMDGSGSQAVTRPDMSLDAWARLHESQGRPFASFNVSNACPGGFAPPFLTGGMIYSSGIGGVQGVEIWGHLDGSVYGDRHPIFGWNQCSPMMGCTPTAPLPMCATIATAPGGRSSARVPEDWPSALSAAVLKCGVAGEVISRVEFASFGVPEGDCHHGFRRNATCASHPDRTREVVEGLCVGRARCAVPATRDAFGGVPCTGVTLNLAVTVQCKSSMHLAVAAV